MQLNITSTLKALEMKIRLKQQYIDALQEHDRVELFCGRALVISQPRNPADDIECRMGTQEGRKMLEAYEQTKHLFQVGITTPYINEYFEDAEAITSKVSTFNTKADAIHALAHESLEVGFMPLQYLSIALCSDKSPLVIIPS